MRTGQRGMGNMQVMLALAVIVLVCLAGWWLFARERPRTIPEAIADPNFNNTKYLEIPELGIRFALSDDIEDAYYFLTPDRSVYFSLHRYDDQAGMEGCRAQGNDDRGGGLAALGSAKLGETKNGKVWTREQLAAVNAKQVGATYYWMEIHVNEPCYDTNRVSTETSEVRSISQFKESFLKQQSTISRL